MQICLPNLRTPVLIGLAFTLPFLLLEVINQGLDNGFPVALFLFIWLLPTAFAALLIPVIQYLRAGGKLFDHPFSLLVRLLVLIMLASMWFGIITDQMPCFLGVPNCD